MKLLTIGLFMCAALEMLHVTFYKSLGNRPLVQLQASQNVTCDISSTAHRDDNVLSDKNCFVYGPLSPPTTPRVHR